MNEFADFARRLAEASAAIIIQYYRTDVKVEQKADCSPVTIVDRKAEEVMRELIMKHYPDHGILGEEFGEHNPGAAYQWVLDPIDGTKSFITGTPQFGTLIALLRDGRPILGVINQPALGEFLIGVDGQTRLNDRRVFVRRCASIEEATLLTSAHWTAHKYQNGAAYDALSRRVRLYRTWGDCHGYYLLATGYADIVLDPIMSAWDLMALIPVVEGAGGRITDWRGGDAVSGSSIIATAGAIHDEVVRFLNPLPPAE